MPKDYTATKLDDILIRIKIPAFDGETNNHYAASLKITGKVSNGSFFFPIDGDKEYIGTSSSVPYTNAEIYFMINNFNSLNTFLAEKLKQLYIDAINEDPS